MIKNDNLYRDIQKNISRIVCLQNMFRFDKYAILNAFLIHKNYNLSNMKKAHIYYTVLKKDKTTFEYENCDAFENYLLDGKNMYFSYKEELRHIAINHFKYKNELTTEILQDKSEFSRYNQKLGMISTKRALIELNTNSYLVKEIKDFNNKDYLDKLYRLEVIKDKMILNISKYFTTEQERNELKINQLKNNLEKELVSVKIEKRLKI